MFPGLKLTLLLTLAVLLCAIPSAQGQTCNLKLTNLRQAQELMGFQMGMSKDQVKARVPQVVFGNTDDLGSSKTTINPDFNPRIDKTTFAGVRSVSLDFLDGKLTSLWFGYDGTFKWKTIDDFVKGISASMGLPDKWDSWRGRGQQLKCADFSMTVTIVAEGPSFRILDHVADDLVAARRQAKENAAEAATGANGEETEESSEADESPVVGDRSNKTYYGSECAPAKPIKDKDQIAFRNAAEAQKAGYKKASNCP